MAFVADDPNKLQDPSQGQAQGQSQSGASPQPQLSGEGGETVSAGGAQSGNPAQASTGQAGSGGTNSWTNIQSYINANQGNTGSADIAKNAIGGQFDKEKSNLDTQADGYTQQAQKAAGSAKQNADSANQWLGQATKDYDWTNPQASAYQADLGKFKDAMGAKYSGPSSFSYGMSGDTQNYGNTLGDDKAFNQFLGDQYQQKAGGQLSDGSRNLQSQLDSSNQSLANTRQDLLKQYSGLGDYAKQKTADTNATLAKSEQDFRTNQNAFGDYLGTQNNAARDNVSKAERDAKYGYQTDLGGASDHRAAGMGFLDSMRNNSGFNTGGINSYGVLPAWQEKDAAGLGGQNLSWNDLQKDKDMFSWDGNRQGIGGTNGVSRADIFNQDHADNNAALDKFYGDETAKYQNTGDEDKRKWNAIQDILGTSADRKKQGFDVRGS